MHVCVVTARARVLWPPPDIYCNYYVRAKFKPGAAPGCYGARGNTAHVLFKTYYDVINNWGDPERVSLHGTWTSECSQCQDKLCGCQAIFRIA